MSPVGTVMLTDVTVPVPPVPVTQTPFNEKQPEVRLMPFAKVEEAVVEAAKKLSPKMLPCTASFAPGVEVPMPKKSVVVETTICST